MFRRQVAYVDLMTVETAISSVNIIRNLPPTKREVYVIARDVCLSVWLSVSKITQNRVRGFGWNFAYRCRDMDKLIKFWARSGHNPDAGTPESRRSVKVGQTGTSLRAGYRSRDALQRYSLLHIVVQGPGSFADPVDFSVRCTVAELRGVKVAQFSDFGLFSPYKTLKTPKC